MSDRISLSLTEFKTMSLTSLPLLDFSIFQKSTCVSLAISSSSLIFAFCLAVSGLGGFVSFRTAHSPSLGMVLAL